MSRWPRFAAAAFDDTARLIPGSYTELAEHALSDLSDDEDELQSLIVLSAVTNSRLQAQEDQHPGGLGRSDLVFNLPYSKIINGAFAYAGQGARFHSADGRGAWYCALDVATALAEVAYHRIKQLRETGLDTETDIPYRLFTADVHGQDFAWLDDDTPRTRACLDPDSYAAGQGLGLLLLDRSAGGVVYPAVRHPGGTNIAVLQPAIVANVRREALLHVTIEAGRLTHVERTD